MSRSPTGSASRSCGQPPCWPTMPTSTRTARVSATRPRSLLNAAERAGVDWRALRSAHPRRAEDPFDSGSMRMAVLTGDTIHAKGAPEVLLADGSELAGAAGLMGKRALRTLAIGRRPVPDHPVGDEGDLPLSTTGCRCSAWSGSTTLRASQRFRPWRPFKTPESAWSWSPGDQPRTAQAVAEQIGLRAGRVLSGRELPASTTRRSVRPPATSTSTRGSRRSRSCPWSARCSTRGGRRRHRRRVKTRRHCGRLTWAWRWAGPARTWPGRRPTSS
jgi:hypothetical protein